MDHEQVRFWILEGHPADLATSQLAAEHLAVCAECQAFSDRWSAARQALDARPVVTPEAGFSARWFERLVLARQRRHRRQTVLALSLSAFGSISTFAVMAWWVLEAPAKAAGIVLGQLASLNAQLRVILESLRIVANALPPFANFGLLWAGMAAALGLILLYTGFSALWTASFYRAVLQTRTKEN